MKRLVWLNSAKMDLLDIQAYYTEKVSVSVAAKLLQRIFVSAEYLVEQPLMGSQTMDDHILEWHIPDIDYTLPYRVQGDDVEILRVFHQSQEKPSKWEL